MTSYLTHSQWHAASAQAANMLSRGTTTLLRHRPAVHALRRVAPAVSLRHVHSIAASPFLHPHPHTHVLQPQRHFSAGLEKHKSSEHDSIDDDDDTTATTPARSTIRQQQTTNPPSSAREQQRIQQLERTPAMKQHVAHDQPQSSTAKHMQNMQDDDTATATEAQLKAAAAADTKTQVANRQSAKEVIRRMQYWKRDAADLPEKQQLSTSSKQPLPVRLYRQTLNFLLKVINYAAWLVTNPQQIPAVASSAWKTIKHEAHHYYTGGKLFAADVRTAAHLVKKTTRGQDLSRRERRQLRRTFTDALRIIPFSVFVIVPFMELLLPVALKLFPNMLPSTFRDPHKAEEQIKRELRVRLDMAEFLQESLETMARERAQGKKGKVAESAQQLLEIISNVREGRRVKVEDLVKASKFFSDEVTLDNLSRAQLVSMCRYMSINPFGTDEMLRFQLEQRLRKIKQDDKLIHREGLDTLTLSELKQACRERGMRSDGLTRAGFMRNLQQWIDLSLDKEIPATLLILSRAFGLREKRPEADDIKNALSSLDEELLDEVIREAGLSDYEQRLESLKRQNELIEDEEEERTERKARVDKLKLEREKELMERIFKIRPDLKEAMDKRNLQADSSSKDEAAASERDTTTEMAEGGKSADAKSKSASDSKSTSSDDVENMDEAELARQVAAELASLASPSALDKERARLKALKAKADKAAADRKAAEESLAAKAKSAKGTAMEGGEKIVVEALPEEEKATLKRIIKTQVFAARKLEEAEARVQSLENARKGETEVVEQLKDQVEEKQQQREEAEEQEAKADEQQETESADDDQKTVGDKLQERKARAKGQSKQQQAAEAAADDQAPATASEDTRPITQRSKDTAKGMTLAKREEQMELSDIDTADTNSDADASEVEEQAKEEAAAEEQDDSSSDKSAQRLQSRVDKMLRKLERQMEEADIKIGTKLHLLDQDHDAMVSEQELTQTITQLFRHISSPELAQRIAKHIAELTHSQNGQIKVQQLTELAEQIENERKKEHAEDEEKGEGDKEVQQASASSSRNKSRAAETPSSDKSKSQRENDSQ